ncbi:MAG: helix-turn-helix transcriptional regulator [Saprospiraceae bacterium]|nr:helix-turn-helix transcriptional regulator [Saprospiraceae bacterium]
MEKDKLSTESIIKQAAMEVFLKDGFDGARMQKIADLAGVNKAMLHYYFSSKDVMFEKIFAEAMSDLVPHIEK